MNYVKKLDILPGFALEGIPNRDSVKYADLYGIAAEAQTVFRGSLRYHGKKNYNSTELIIWLFHRIIEMTYGHTSILIHIQLLIIK